MALTKRFNHSHDYELLKDIIKILTFCAHFFPSEHSKILGLNQIVSCITHSDLLAIHLLTMSKTIIIKALNYYIIPNVLGHLRACYPVWKLLVRSWQYMWRLNSCKLHIFFSYAPYPQKMYVNNYNSTVTKSFRIITLFTSSCIVNTLSYSVEKTQFCNDCRSLNFFVFINLFSDFINNKDM